MNRIKCCCGSEVEWPCGPTTYVVEVWIKRHDKCVELVQRKPMYIKDDVAVELWCDDCRHRSLSVDCPHQHNRHFKNAHILLGRRAKQPSCYHKEEKIH